MVDHACIACGKEHVSCCGSCPHYAEWLKLSAKAGLGRAEAFVSGDASGPAVQNIACAAARALHETSPEVKKSAEPKRAPADSLVGDPCGLPSIRDQESIHDQEMSRLARANIELAAKNALIEEQRRGLIAELGILADFVRRRFLPTRDVILHNDINAVLSNAEHAIACAKEPPPLSRPGVPDGR